MMKTEELIEIAFNPFITPEQVRELFNLLLVLQAKGENIELYSNDKVMKLKGVCDG